MNFNHCPPTELVNLKTKNIDGKRYYIIEENELYFPSITSILGSFAKPGIEKWKKRVGKAEAERITRQSAAKGTSIHSLCEKYLLNEDVSKRDVFPHIYENFLTIRPHLDKIDNVHYVECPLYSMNLQVAGRCDAIAEFDGKLSVIDFKTSRKIKKEEWIEDYFLQTTFYALSYWELTNIKIKQVVIIIAVENEQPQVFIKPIANYVKPLISKIKKYRENTLQN